jgi:hypothetical protein
MKRLGLGDHDIVSAARQRCGHDVNGGEGGKKTGAKKKKGAVKRPRDDGTGGAEDGGEGEGEGGGGGGEAAGGGGGGGEDGERAVRRSSRRLAGMKSEDGELPDDEAEEEWRGRSGRGGAIQVQSSRPIASKRLVSSLEPLH